MKRYAVRAYTKTSIYAAKVEAKNEKHACKIGRELLQKQAFRRLTRVFALKCEENMENPR